MNKDSEFNGPSDSLLSHKTFLRPDEAAKILRVSRRVIYYMCAERALESAKIRGVLKIKVDGIKELLGKRL